MIWKDYLKSSEIASYSKLARVSKASTHPPQPRRNRVKAWFTLATEAETEESLRSSVNHENGDGSTSGSSTETETEGTDSYGSFPFTSIASSASVELTSQTSKCEPVLTEAQAEREGWANGNTLFQSVKTKFDLIRSKINCKCFFRFTNYFKIQCCQTARYKFLKRLKLNEIVP